MDYGYSVMNGRHEVEHFDTYEEALNFVSRDDNDYTELNIADTEAVLQWHEINNYKHHE